MRWHRNQLDAQCPLLRQLAQLWVTVGTCRKAQPHPYAKLFIIQQMVILLFNNLHSATLQWSMDTATVSLHQIETSEKLCCEAALAWTENFSCTFISLAFFWQYISSVFVQLQSDNTVLHLLLDSMILVCLLLLRKNLWICGPEEREKLISCIYFHEALSWCCVTDISCIFMPQLPWCSGCLLQPL